MPRSKKGSTWHGDWPIPKRLNLPGCRVEVRFKSNSDMAEDGIRHGYWTYDHAEGFARIYLNSNDNLEVQRYTLLHELQHALVEIMDVMLENYPDQVQTYAMSQVGWIIDDQTDDTRGIYQGSRNDLPRPARVDGDAT